MGANSMIRSGGRGGDTASLCRRRGRHRHLAAVGAHCVSVGVAGASVIGGVFNDNILTTTGCHEQSGLDTWSFCVLQIEQE
jgi:hypothetical protein